MSDDRLTPEELAAMPEKTKKHPHITEMYLRNDYRTAYAMHTDDRVRTGGPEAAVGAVGDWDLYGDYQCGFLRRCGLLPGHTLLDIGCGTGRLARKMAGYLAVGNYTGVDLSADAIRAAVELSEKEGWADRKPSFVCSRSVTVFTQPFDFIWAFSVFIHLPEEIMRDVFLQAAAYLRNRKSKFYFSYCNEPYYARTGLKQFRHTVGMYAEACAVAKLHIEFGCGGWEGSQKIAVATLR